MRNMVDGPIVRHILAVAGPTMIGAAVQTVYSLIDLFFVGHLGVAAIAGVGSAATLAYLFGALHQILASSTVTLISQAIGRKDAATTNYHFNQLAAFSAIGFFLPLLLIYFCAVWYLRIITQDPSVVVAGKEFLFFIAPAYALNFPLYVMGSALRAAGNARAMMTGQLFIVVMNILLAPILINGWVTGYPMGVKGAGLSTTLAVALGTAVMCLYVAKYKEFFRLDPQLFRVSPAVFKRIAMVGTPVGAEFILSFGFAALIFTMAGKFGAAFAAGYGIGSRILFASYVPAFAIASFSTPAVAGQNFGAGLYTRVRETFYWAVTLSVSAMLVVTFICQQWSTELISLFTPDHSTIVAGSEFLRICSWSCVLSAVIFSCSGLFQALGNTLPSLFSSFVRIFIFAIYIFWISSGPDFKINQIWHLFIISIAIQTITSVYMLNKIFLGTLKINLFYKSQPIFSS